MRLRFTPFLISLTLIGSSLPVYAVSKEELLKERQSLESRLQESEKVRSETSERLTLTKQERKQVEQKLEAVNDRLNVLAQDIADQQATIDAARDQLDGVRLDILLTEDDLKRREERVGDRLRAVQRSGDVKYVEVLLGAKDFGDLISRFNTVSTIIARDDAVLREYLGDIRRLNERKAEQERLLDSLKRGQLKLLGLRRQIDAEAAEKRSLLEQLDREVGQLEQERLTEAEAAEVLAAQAELVSKQLKQLEEAEALAKAKAKAEAAAREKKAEAEARAKAEAKAKSRDEKRDQPPSPAPAEQPIEETRTFVLPVQGYVSSPFGPRNNPLSGKSEIHTGIDLVNAEGTPVVAAAAGVVLRAGSATGYGNVVMVTHLIDGAIWTTVYGHLSGVSVKAGQTVAPGQMVGTLGSTGWSTGPHLHFEIHNGQWAPGQPNAVDPAAYLF
ncbi:murein hydrolase activator EnvC family protein [Exiguobacterium flavidum]|uniref:murein hydrolase activator EnvC family protein n=1 Tax=Exiguobacterium flavidum TaxID=2184695 RepID=UPI000DF796BE|nr:peptidoglycan DD-metalloendopeptidase family protein [Exiguobacterium flavidum]